MLEIRGRKKLEKMLITNNPLIKKKFINIYLMEFYDIGYLSILEIVRDKIHLGHKLLSHPLLGSIKFNQSPYETVIISKNRMNLDMDSLISIENSIQMVKKFMQNQLVYCWDQKALEDFQKVDFSLIENALSIHLHC